MIYLLRISLIIFIVISQNAYAQKVTIAVASNMKPAFEAIYQDFTLNHPKDIRIVYGSSGNLASQIKQGAPFSLLIAADELFPKRLFQEGLTKDAGVVYATGHLALISNIASGIQLNPEPSQIKALLSQSKKIAIANPELAPYGNAAVQYLKSSKLWDATKAKLVYGENISVATMYVSAGAANVGITALSLAKAPELSGIIQFIPLPDDLYTPILQRMILMKNPPPLAMELYDYLQGPSAKIILQRYGYSLP